VPAWRRRIPRIFWIFLSHFFRKVELFAHSPAKIAGHAENSAGRGSEAENFAGHYFPHPRKIDV
jgi:hypothetical protein